VPAFLVAIVILGLSGIVAQLLLLRELLVTFLSNELTIGVILGNWLLLEAAGAYAAGRLLERSKRHLVWFAAVTFLFSLALPAAAYFARAWKAVLGLSPGEAFGIHQTVYSSLLILLPVSVPHGALFPIASRIYASLSGQQAAAIGRIYFWELVGTIAGGAICTPLLITRLTALDIALGISLANAGVLVWLTTPRRSGVLASPAIADPDRSILRRGLWSGSLALVVLLIGALFGLPAARLHESSLKRQWSFADVVHSENSIYGNVAVLHREGQYTYFAGGIPVITAPTPDTAFVEEFVHLPLLLHGNPRHILVMTGGAGGILHEVLKHPVKQVDYVELDPLILSLLRRFPTPLTESELTDPRVHIHHMDGRLFLRRTSRRFDAIFHGLSTPQDLQANRFFTAEFFAQAADRLAPDGVLVISLPGSTTYMGPDLRVLNTGILAAMRTAFPAVRLIGGEGHLLVVASPSPGLETFPADLPVQRLAAARLDVRSLTPALMRYRLDPRRSREVLAALGETPTRVNRDLAPVGVYHSLALWTAQIAPRLRAFLSRLEGVTLERLAILLILGCLLCAAVLRGFGRLSQAALPMAIGATGFAGMVLSLALLFVFQARYGVVYFWMSLLITAFMAGSAAGSLWMTSYLKRAERDIAMFLGFEAAFVVFAGGLPLVAASLYPAAEALESVALLQILFVLLFILAGLLVGLEFPLAGQIRLRAQPEVASTVGVLYGADLLGGWAGGLIGGALLLPLLGVADTCLLVALIKFLSLLLVLAGRAK
jgi:spermidine synthase